MSSQVKTYLKFGSATLLIFFLLGYLAYTGVQDSKSYYVTIQELIELWSGPPAVHARPGNLPPAVGHAAPSERRVEDGVAASPELITVAAPLVTLTVGLSTTTFEITGAVVSVWLLTMVKPKKPGGIAALPAPPLAA